MYFYNFLYDYEIDTILCSDKKWTNEELLTILKDYKKSVIFEAVTGKIKVV